MYSGYSWNIMGGYFGAGTILGNGSGINEGRRCCQISGVRVARHEGRSRTVDGDNVSIEQLGI